MFVLCICIIVYILFFFFKQKTAYEMRISDWSSDVCSSDLSYDLCRLYREHTELFDDPVGRVVGGAIALVGGVTEPPGNPHEIANLSLLIDIFPLAVAENDDAVPVAILDPLVAFCAAAIVRANRDVRDLGLGVDLTDPSNDLEFGKIDHAASSLGLLVYGKAVIPQIGRAHV